MRANIFNAMKLLVTVMVLSLPLTPSWAQSKIEKVTNTVVRVGEVYFDLGATVPEKAIGDTWLLASEVDWIYALLQTDDTLDGVIVNIGARNDYVEEYLDLLVNGRILQARQNDFFTRQGFDIFREKIGEELLLVPEGQIPDFVVSCANPREDAYCAVIAKIFPKTKLHLHIRVYYANPETTDFDAIVEFARMVANCLYSGEDDPRVAPARKQTSPMECVDSNR